MMLNQTFTNLKIITRERKHPKKCLSPCWGLEETSGVHSIPLCLFISLYLYLSVTLSGRPHLFLEIMKSRPVIACSACSHRPQVLQYNINSGTLSPHWGMEETNGFQLSLYIYPTVSMPLNISVYLSLCLVICVIFLQSFVWPVISRSACGHIPRGQKPEWQYNMSVCFSLRLVVCGPFSFFVFVLIFSKGVQRRNAFIPTLGSEGTQWVPVELICTSLCLSVCSYVYLFDNHFCSP